MLRKRLSNDRWNVTKKLMLFIFENSKCVSSVPNTAYGLFSGPRDWWALLWLNTNVRSQQKSSTFDWRMMCDPSHRQSRSQGNLSLTNLCCCSKVEMESVGLPSKMSWSSCWFGRKKKALFDVPACPIHSAWNETGLREPSSESFMKGVKEG